MRFGRLACVMALMAASLVGCGGTDCTDPANAGREICGANTRATAQTGTYDNSYYNSPGYYQQQYADPYGQSSYGGQYQNQYQGGYVDPYANGGYGGGYGGYGYEGY